jgi:hypothetical protein
MIPMLRLLLAGLLRGVGIAQAADLILVKNILAASGRRDTITSAVYETLGHRDSAAPKTSGKGGTRTDLAIGVGSVGWAFGVLTGRGHGSAILPVVRLRTRYSNGGEGTGHDGGKQAGHVEGKLRMACNLARGDFPCPDRLTLNLYRPGARSFRGKTQNHLSV